LVTGEIERHSAHAVVIASGGYGNVFLSTNAMGVTLRQLGKYTKGLFQILVTHKFTQHVFLFQEIINPN
jgi:uridylate kinase